MSVTPTPLSTFLLTLAIFCLAGVPVSAWSQAEEKPDKPAPAEEPAKPEPEAEEKDKPASQPESKPKSEPKDDKDDKEKEPAKKPEKKPEPKAAEKKPAPPKTDDEFGFEEIQMLATVMELIRQNYVDEKKVSYEKLINSALEGMLADLDPHCQFLYPEVFAQMRRETGSTYEGVGITVGLRSDVLTIVAVREDGPAARAGVLPGDQIIKINEFLAEKIGLAEAMQLMRGKPGQKLSLTLRRPANNELLEVEMVREVIRQSTVEDVMMLPERYAGDLKIGYVRLLQFSQPTLKELREGLDELEQAGMQALVLDLRNNPGGLLSSAVGVCGEFVPPDTLVLTTEGRSGVSDAKVYRTPARKERKRDYPMAILVNHASASGAEVVAGALQDLNRAVIVGETTFGKGSVQSIIPVPGGEDNAIRLTTAKYYAPSRRTIHENGVEPNIVATLTPQDERQLMRWFQRETLPNSERRKLDDWRDRQLSRAADALKGVLVYSQTFAKAREEEKPEPAPEPKPEKEEPKPEPEPEKPKAEEKSEPEPDSEPADPEDKKGEEEKEPLPETES